MTLYFKNQTIDFPFRVKGRDVLTAFSALAIKPEVIMSKMTEDEKKGFCSQFGLNPDHFELELRKIGSMAKRGL